jgi:hypothetical protein
VTQIASARGIITSSAKALGVDLPTALNDRFVEATELLGSARKLGSERTHFELLDAVVDELRSGNDPLGSAEVQRLALAQALASVGVAGAVQNLTDQLIAQALTDNADSILSAWSKALTPHAANLTAAADKLTDNLHDLPSIQRHPVAYSQAVDALHRFDEALQGALQLASMAHVRVNEHALFFIADTARLPELKRAAALRSENRPSPWLAARHGITVKFVSSLGELMERSAQYRQQRAEANKAATPQGRGSSWGELSGEH